MSIQHILETMESLEHVVTLAPDEKSGLPEIAWGDYFFYYSPDGKIPDNVQPFATIVTKDYPDDAQSGLDPDGRFRVNIHVGRDRLSELTIETMSSESPPDPSRPDEILPHPVYSSLGWVAVVNPGEETAAIVDELLELAHDDARQRSERRGMI